MKPKTFFNRSMNELKQNVSDVQIFGEDLFKLLSKAFSEAEGWMKSTKAMEIPGVGCVVQVTTQQKNQDGNYVVAEALTFVPNVRIVEQEDYGNPKIRTLRQAYPEPVEPPLVRWNPDEKLKKTREIREEVLVPNRTKQPMDDNGGLVGPEEGLSKKIVPGGGLPKKKKIRNKEK